MCTLSGSCFPRCLQCLHTARQGAARHTQWAARSRPGGSTQGVIPSVMDDIFARISSTKDADYTVRVGFVEIHQVNRLSACITVAAPEAAAQQPRGTSILRPLLLSSESRAKGCHLTLGGLGLLSPLGQLLSTESRCK